MTDCPDRTFVHTLCSTLDSLMHSPHRASEPYAGTIADIETRIMARLDHIGMDRFTLVHVLKSLSLPVFEACLDRFPGEIRELLDPSGDQHPVIHSRLLRDGDFPFVFSVISAGMQVKVPRQLLKRIIAADDAEALRQFGAFTAPDTGTPPDALDDHTTSFRVIAGCGPGCAPLLAKWFRGTLGYDSRDKQVSYFLHAFPKDCTWRPGAMKFLAAHIAAGLDMSSLSLPEATPALKKLITSTSSHHGRASLEPLSLEDILSRDASDQFYGFTDTDLTRKETV